ncbi:MAG: single-stranded-DNA-specific exonuclease RecJ [Clostridia bacterium]|nr:single-stranded-DNA-specific exonuclease RecJ [Clostridia bacterium]
MSFKKWVIKSYDRDIANALCSQAGFSGALSVLLSGRGIGSFDEARDFLACDAPLIDPFTFAGMEKAAERINRAIERGEHITVYGDYDADGVTATALLFSYLEARGALADYYIPEREGEGYGLHVSSADTLLQRGTQLIITVDNGISSIEEVKYINSLGIEVIVTDHHTPEKTLPDAVSVVNPHRSDCPSGFKHYAGVGVAFKLIQALEGDIDEQMLLEEYSDLFTLGTIGDVVSLTGENRNIIKRGLDELVNTSRIGIRALIDVSGMTGKKMTGMNVAFSLVPRINAAGRMGSPERAVRLLLTNDEDEAVELANELENDNRRRQEVEHDIFEQAQEQIENDPSLLRDRVLVLSGEGWHRGVTGIVATRMCEKYGRPCIMISSDGEDAKGSGRSIEGFSLYEAIKYCSDILIRFGGHTLAAGLNIKTAQIPVLRKMINEYAMTVGHMPVPQLNLDFKLNPMAVNMNILEDINLLEPFGSGNPTPVFGLYKMQLQSVQPLSGGKHLKLTAKRREAVLQMVRFNYPAQCFPYKPGDLVDFAVVLSQSEFRGEKNLSVIVKDMRPSGFDEEGFLEGRSRYEDMLRGEPVDGGAGFVPDRRCIAAVYRYLRQNNPVNTEMSVLFHRLRGQTDMTRLCLSLDILSELGLISYKREDDMVCAEIIDVKAKTDLEKSAVLGHVKAVYGRT